jgi:hypothetical protein
LIVDITGGGVSHFLFFSPARRKALSRLIPREGTDSLLHWLSLLIYHQSFVIYVERERERSLGAKGSPIAFGFNGSRRKILKYLHAAWLKQFARRNSEAITIARGKINFWRNRGISFLAAVVSP